MSHTLRPLVRKLEREATLSDEEKQAVLKLRVTVRDMQADHDVVRERDKPSQCCLVLDGWLQRYRLLGNGTRQIFAFHIPGDLPDLQSLYLKTMDHNLAPVVQSRVAFIQHDVMRNLIKSFPHLGEILWRDTLIDAAIFRQWIVGMGRKDAPQRIAHLFCEMFTKMRAVGLTDGNSCEFPLTQAAIGDALGLSTVHVNRSLMELRRQGFITLERRTLTILDWDALQGYSEFDSLYLHMDIAQAA
jgi:CRP-like cAMP-binding protein